MDISLSCWVNLICAKLKPRSGIQKAILSKSNFLKRKFIPTQYSILCGFNKGCTTIGRWSENNRNSHKIAIFGCFGRLPLFCVDFSRLWRFTDYLTTSSQIRIPLLLGVEKCIFEKFNFPHTTSPLDWWFLPFIFLGSLPAAQEHINCSQFIQTLWRFILFLTLSGTHFKDSKSYRSNYTLFSSHLIKLEAKTKRNWKAAKMNFIESAELDNKAVCYRTIFGFREMCSILRRLLFTNLIEMCGVVKRIAWFAIESMANRASIQKTAVWYINNNQRK